MLAGLPAAYIIQQVHDMRSRARRSAWSGPFPPSDLMFALADSITDAELAAAARYFASLAPQQRSRVVEAAAIPRAVPSLGLHLSGEGTEPLGQRLLTMPLDVGRHEVRDPLAEYITYAPAGSLARGGVLAAAGAAVISTACTACHGPALRGAGAAPPIAGRSPTYLLRQLLAFKTGTRATAAGAPMGVIVEGLGLDDLIAAAAYAGSLAP